MNFRLLSRFLGWSVVYALLLASSVEAQKRYVPQTTEPIQDLWRENALIDVPEQFYDFSQSEEGQLWVGVKDGMASFDGLRWQIFRKKGVGALQWIHALNRYTVFGGNETGLYRLREGTLEILFRWPFVLKQPVRTVNVAGEDGAAWFLTDFGLLRIEQSQIDLFQPEYFEDDGKNAHPTVHHQRLEVDANGYIKNELFSNYGKDETDLKARFSTACDEEFLYFWFDVTDDTLLADSEWGYLDDSVEIFLDLDDSKDDTYDSTDHQINVRVDGRVEFIRNSRLNSAATVATREVEGGYQMEVRISWAHLGVRFEEGMQIGLDVQVNDDDHLELDRDEQLNLIESDSGYFNPSVFPSWTVGGRDDELSIPFLSSESIDIDGQREAVWTTLPQHDISNYITRYKLISGAEGDDGRLYFTSKAGQIISADLSQGLPKRASSWLYHGTVFECTDAPSDKNKLVYYDRKLFFFERLKGLKLFALWSLNLENGQWKQETKEYSQRGYLQFATETGTVFGNFRDQLIYWKAGMEDLASFRNPLMSSREHFHYRNGRLWIGQGSTQTIDQFDLSSDVWLSRLNLTFQCNTPDGRFWFTNNYGKIVHTDVPEDPHSDWIIEEDPGLPNKVSSIDLLPDGSLVALGGHQEKAAAARLKDGVWSRRLFENFGRYVGGGGRPFIDEDSLFFGYTDTLDWNKRASAGGFVHFDLKKDWEDESAWTIQPGVPDCKLIRSICRLSDGTLYLASSRLFRYEDGYFIAEEIGEREYEHSGTCKRVFVGPEGRLWLLNTFFGPMVKENGVWQKAGERDFRGEYLLDLTRVGSQVWITTSEAAYVFDGENWIPLFQMERKGFMRGLVTVEVDAFGDIWFNGRNSNVSQVKEVVLPDEVFLISQTFRYRRDVTPPDTYMRSKFWELSYRADKLIEWNGLDHWLSTATEKLTYSWRVDGGDWTPFTSDTSLALHDVEDGKYLIEVRARDLALNVDPTPAVLEFTVKPPVVRQAWFRLLIGFFLFLCFYQGVRILRQRAQLKRSNEELVMANNYLKQTKDEVEAAYRAKSEFLSKMSHEIRTPMNGIIGMTELTLNSEMDEHRKDCLHTVLSSAMSLLRIVDDIFDFSEFEAGKLKLERRMFSIRGCLDRAVASVREAADAKELTFTCRIDENLEDNFIGDARRFEQVLFNLLDNAVKFSRIGEITLELKALEGTDTTKTIQCSVRDTGIGIAEDKLDSIFYSFEQADSSSTREFDGTGLGLAICKMIVEKMGGSIGVESEVDKGSVFTFTAQLELPEKKEKKGFFVRGGSADALEAPARKLKVLLVEEDPVNQAIVMNVLEKRGHEVEQSYNAEHACELLKHNRFDCVLYDFETEEPAEGAHAIELIRQEEKQAGAHRVAILGMSRADSAESNDVFKGVDIDGLVKMPAGGEKMVRAVESICKR